MGILSDRNKPESIITIMIGCRMKIRWPVGLGRIRTHSNRRCHETRWLYNLDYFPIILYISSISAWLVSVFARFDVVRSTVLSANFLVPLKSCARTARRTHIVPHKNRRNNNRSARFDAIRTPRTVQKANLTVFARDYRYVFLKRFCCAHLWRTAEFA